MNALFVCLFFRRDVRVDLLLVRVVEGKRKSARATPGGRSAAISSGESPRLLSMAMVRTQTPVPARMGRPPLKAGSRVIREPISVKATGISSTGWSLGDPSHQKNLLATDERG
jgi:hypothetical protein